TEPPRDGVRYDFVILPGSKHTASDLAWLRARGFDRWLRDQHERGATMIGICGGFQMLGRTIADPDGVEPPDAGTVLALGLLPVETVLSRAKTTCQRRATLAQAANAATAASGASEVSFEAYEIHLGVTRAVGTTIARFSPFAMLDDGTAEGLQGDG